MTNIHPTAIISENATIAGDVIIGPYCVIGDEVEIGSGTELKPHVCIDGITKIGQNNTIYPFASIGYQPQDLKFKGEHSELIIGDNNIIREYVTMNPGTEGGGSVTQVGNNCLFMVGTHIAHDCQVGDHVVMANNVTLAGHITIGNHVVMGGLSGAHQFVRIGDHAMIGGMAGVEHDVIPYGLVMGERASLAGLNLTGLKRRGFDRDTIHALRNAYKDIFDSDDGTLAGRIEKAAAKYSDIKAVKHIADFAQVESQRQLCTPTQQSVVEAA